MASGQGENAVDRVPVGVKVGYGAAEWSLSLVFTTLAVFFLVFLTDVVGVDPSIASIVLSVAVLWDAFFGPAMGVISDRTKGRYGRRRPYLIVAALPFGLIFWLTFSVPPLEGNMLVGYFVVMSLMMYTALTAISVPYTALVPEMTRDYDERTSLVSYRVGWSQMGAIVGAAVPLLIVQQFSSPKMGWSVASAVLGFCCVLPILATWHHTRGWEGQSVDSEPLRIAEVYGAVVGNRPFRYLIGMYLFSITAVYAVAAMAPYFLRYWMGFSGNEISIYLLFVFSFGLFWIPAIAAVSNRLGKRSAFMIFLGLCAITGGVGNMIVQPGQMRFVYLLAIVTSVGTVATYQLVWSMIPDVVEVDELKTGRRREGLYYGVAMFFAKLGSALAVFLVGQALAWIGYVPNEIQSPSVLLGIRIMFGPVIAGVMGVSIAIAIFVPMTRDRHKALLRAIEAKKSGQQWDEEGIRELL